MALTATVKTARYGRSMTFRNDNGQLMIRRKIIHDVHLSGLGESAANYAGVSELEILTAPGLPLVNYSVYQFGTKIVPYLICRQKTLKETKSLKRWKVECSYDTENRGKENGQTPTDPPAAVEDLSPRVDRSSEIMRRVVYKDRNDKLILSPTGNYYAEPAVVPLPINVITVTQYELGFTDDDIETRTGTVNENTFRGKPTYSWYIDTVNAEETRIPLNGGGTADCHQVQYVIKHNSLADGWKETRALIDTHYLEVANNKDTQRPFMDGLQNTTGWIKPDGTIQPYADGLEFETYELLEKIPWPFLDRVDSP